MTGQKSPAYILVAKKLWVCSLIIPGLLERWLVFVRVINDIWKGNFISGEASPTFGHANVNFPVFINRIRNQFLKSEY